MAIQFIHTDKYGHVDTQAYGKIVSILLSKEIEDGDFAVARLSVYKDAAARTADINGFMQPQKAYDLDLSDTVIAEALDAFFAKVYDHLQTLDADLAAGTDV